PEDFIEVPILECEMAAPISVRRLLGRSPLPQDSFDLSTIPYLHLGCSGRWECAHTRAAAGEPLSPVSQATGAERAVLLVQQALCRHCGRQDRLQKAVEVKSQALAARAQHAVARYEAKTLPRDHTELRRDLGEADGLGYARGYLGKEFGRGELNHVID